MSVIRPFRAFRPRPELAARIASFPYDVVDSDEARELAKGNPYSFLHVGKPEIDLDPSISLYDKRVYAKGAENLNKLIRDRALIRDESPCLYLYQQTMDGHSQVGVVCACSVREYEQGLIKRHEHTRKAKEDDRTRHVTETNANAEPVFLTYRAVLDIDAVVDRVRERAPACDIITEDGVGHTVWVMSDPTETEELVELFMGVPALYIADGHHRTAAAVRHGQAARSLARNPTGDEPYEFFMAVVFPDRQLRIMDYNRVVMDLNGLSEDAFLERLAHSFRVEPATGPRPERKGEFGMYLDGKWRLLTAREGTWPADDPVRGLDASILQDNLLGPILGIRDPRSDNRIDFVGGIRGTDELEKRCRGDWKVAFTLFPTSLDQLMSVADSGRVMPPKSTWFEPKLRSGLIVRMLDE
ncbi:MAG: DUF1015 domain-containing protein [Deltaproteobacteria bacterium]|nr:DUF1015 domain-containing protein [Deltaproteobacteria bacterium]